MGKLDIQIQGADAVVKELRRRGINVERGLELICHAGAKVIQQEAKSNATGTIALAMSRETIQKRATLVTVAVGPSRRAWFAHFVEYGTKAHLLRPRRKKALLIGGRFVAHAAHPGTRAKPFLRPALDSKRAAAQQAMGDKVKDLVE